jgi:hypothetical protein
MGIEKDISHTVAAGVRDRTGVRAESCDTGATVFVVKHDGSAEGGT